MSPFLFGDNDQACCLINTSTRCLDVPIGVFSKSDERISASDLRTKRAEEHPLKANTRIIIQNGVALTRALIRILRRTTKLSYSRRMMAPPASRSKRWRAGCASSRRDMSVDIPLTGGTAQYGGC